ncbi:helix-turn-helix transcriptional regulator [Frankia sp. AgB32]|uniref:helix-turn-helix domain-containing protein n=1 Tax=Frankia sp. AgB32 TaxID=631119 RepID=UPI00200C38B7|nr:helix-turn-helix transcriptional regulator [Frankia sp. AgB32]MCK9896313.1 helix-turn-helix transcriptional regulator [Frankia sp. AgB32]
MGAWHCARLRSREREDSALETRSKGAVPRPGTIVDSSSGADKGAAERRDERSLSQVSDLGKETKDGTVETVSARRGSTRELSPELPEPVQLFTTELRRVVESAELSQRELAAKLHVSRAQANRYLCGKAKIPATQLDRVAELGSLGADQRDRIAHLWQQAWQPGKAELASPPRVDQSDDGSEFHGTGETAITAATTAAAIASPSPDLPHGQHAAAAVSDPASAQGGERLPASDKTASRRQYGLLAAICCVLAVGFLICVYFLADNPSKAGAEAIDRPSVTAKPVADGNPVSGAPAPASPHPATTASNETSPPGTENCGTWQYRVTAGADVVDAMKTPIARASAGQTFYRALDPTIPKVSYRYYGTLGDGGSAGYILQKKLQFVQKICGQR